MVYVKTVFGHVNVQNMFPAYQNRTFPLPQVDFLDIQDNERDCNDSNDQSTVTVIFKLIKAG